MRPTTNILSLNSTRFPMRRPRLQELLNVLVLILQPRARGLWTGSWNKNGTFPTHLAAPVPTSQRIQEVGEIRRRKNDTGLHVLHFPMSQLGTSTERRRRLRLPGLKRFSPPTYLRGPDLPSPHSSCYGSLSKNSCSSSDEKNIDPTPRFSRSLRAVRSASRNASIHPGT